MENDITPSSDIPTSSDITTSNEDALAFASSVLSGIKSLLEPGEVIQSIRFHTGVRPTPIVHADPPLPTDRGGRFRFGLLLAEMTTLQWTGGEDDNRVIERRWEVHAKPERFLLARYDVTEIVREYNP